MKHEKNQSLHTLEDNLIFQNYATVWISNQKGTILIFFLLYVFNCLHYSMDIMWNFCHLGAHEFCCLRCLEVFKIYSNRSFM